MSRDRKRKKQAGRMSKRNIGFLLIFLVAVISILLVASQTATPQVKVERKAALVDALQPNQTFTEGIIDSLEKAGYTVDVFTGENVTVDFFKEFPAGYRLVILRLHSALYENEGLYFFTGESYDTSKYVMEQLTGDVKRAYAFDGSPPVFAISSSFVGMNMKGKFNDAIIVALGCETMSDPLMPQQFIEQGASAYIGWSGLVSLPHSDEATLQLIKALFTQKITIKQALSQIKPDPDYRSRLLYYPDESGDLKIKELSLIQIQTAIQER